MKRAAAAHRPPHRWWIVVGALVLEASLESPAGGQTPLEESAVAPAPPARSRSIEEIIVTAQKKEQSLQDVPISITALTAEFIEERGLTEIGELVKHTPNVRFDYSACCGVVFVRGLGTSFGGTAFDHTVGLVVDGLYLGQPIYLSHGLLDVERFEVLRGPQGTLFGKNTPAGLFNVTTKEGGEEFSGYVILRGGMHDERRFEAAVGGPVTEWARIRIAAEDWKRPSDLENTAIDVNEPGTEQRAARVKLSLLPMTNVDVLLIAELVTHDGSTRRGQAHRLKQSSLDFFRRYDPEAEGDGFDHHNSQEYRPNVDREADRFQANLGWALGKLGPVSDVQISAILGRSGFDGNTPFDLDETPASILNADPLPFPYRQHSGELHASGSAPGPFGLGEIEFLSGILVFDSNFVTDVTIVAGEHLDDFLVSADAFETVTGIESPGGAGFEDLGSALRSLGIELPVVPDTLEGDGLLLFYEQDSFATALFGQATWRPIERWALTAGLRLNRERKTAHVFLDCFQPGVVCAAFEIMEYDLFFERTENDVSPKVSLQYDWSEELMLFATWAQGFKSGGYNNLSFDGDGIEVEPEKATSWDVGAKGTFFDGALSANLALFLMRAKNLQVQNIEGSTIVRVSNAAEAEIKGLELDFQWLTPWMPLSVYGGLGLLDARFVDYPNAQAQQSSPEASQDLSGKRMPFAPEQTMNLTPTLRLPLPALAVPWLGTRPLAFLISLDVIHQGEAFLDVDLDPNTHQDAYTLLHGRLGVSDREKLWSLTLLGKNLLDQDAALIISDHPVAPDAYSVLQEPGRQIAVELRANF